MVQWTPTNQCQGNWQPRQFLGSRSSPRWISNSRDGDHTGWCFWFNWSFNGFSRCYIMVRGEGRRKNPLPSVCPLSWGNESHEKRQSDRIEEVGCWARNGLLDPKFLRSVFDVAYSITKSVQMLKLVLFAKVYEDTEEDHNPLWIQILIHCTVYILYAYYNCV